MKLNLFLLLCFIGLVSVTVSYLRTVPHNYDLMTTQMSWPDAQNYCRMTYTDLATLQSQTDWLRFTKFMASKSLTTNAWFGLYNDVNSWRWSLNNVSLKNSAYINWNPGEPNNYAGIESCALIIGTGQWGDYPCTGLLNFICYNANFSGAARFIGVTIPLSWSAAQAYCRTHHTDLASALNSSDNYFIQQVAARLGASWFGLYRDTWKWLNGTNASNITWSPGQPNNYYGNENCAVFYNGLFSDEQCTNLHPFFCETSFPMRSQIMRLQVQSDGSVFDPAVQSFLLEQIKQKLEENGILTTTVTWKVQPDGNIFHKKKNDYL